MLSTAVHGDVSGIAVASIFDDVGVDTKHSAKSLFRSCSKDSKREQKRERYLQGSQKLSIMLLDTLVNFSLKELKIHSLHLHKEDFLFV